MKIAINDIIIDTDDICSITELKGYMKSFSSENGNRRSYVSTEFTINFYKGKGDQLLFRVGDENDFNKVSTFRQTIVDIWTRHQIIIPTFKL